MDVDDILFAPLGMQQDNKDFIWQLFLAIIPPEVNINKFSDLEIKEIRKELWIRLDEVGPIEIKNANQLRELLYA
jgi:hypothetical protein